MGRRTLIAITLAGAAAGCDGSPPCIDGVCPDPANSTAYPGPCRGAGANAGVSTACTFTYSGDGHLSRATCAATIDDADYLDDTTWSWNFDGTVAAVAHHEEGPYAYGTELWQFAPDQVVLSIATDPIETLAEYDRATFAFMAHPGDEASRPKAELGLVRRGTTTYTWMVEGARRIRIGSGDHDQSTRETFELDPLGQIVSIERDFGDDGSVESHESFVYDGPRKLQHTRPEPSVGELVEDFAYDDGGNLTEITDNLGYRGVYSYDCW